MAFKQESSDDRSALAIGYVWSVRIMTLALEVALLAFGGHWLDGQLKTKPVFVLVGSVLGLTLFFVHLIAIARQSHE